MYEECTIDIAEKIVRKTQKKLSILLLSDIIALLQLSHCNYTVITLQCSTGPFQRGLIKQVGWQSSTYGPRNNCVLYPGVCWLH